MALRRRNKYKNVKTKAHGKTFDSLLEKAIFDRLSLRVQDGEICNLEHHPGSIFLTQARIVLRPDFRFTFYQTGEIRYAEAKGHETAVWRIKRRLWKSYGPAPLEIWKGSHKNPILKETLFVKGDL